MVAGAPVRAAGGSPAQGAAYVWARPASGWANGTETAELLASDGAANDFLGFAVATSGDGGTVVATAHGKQIGGSAQGAIYVFVRAGAAWASGTESARLIASDGVLGGLLGWSAALSAGGSTLAVGAPTTEIGPNLVQGKVYVFARTGTGWASGSEAAGLTVSDGAANDSLGNAVAVSGDGSAVIAGAPYRQIGANVKQGAAYAFVRPGASWATGTENARLAASDGATNDQLGGAVAVSGDGSVVVAGAALRTVGPNTDQGAATVFGSGAPGATDAWVGVASHGPGANGSQWRSDLGVLNLNAVAANVEVRLHTPGGVVASGTVVLAGGQGVLTDVVGQLGFSGSAALEVASDQPVVVTSRTYDASASGTYGQDVRVVRFGGVARDGRVGVAAAACGERGVSDEHLAHEHGCGTGGGHGRRCTTGWGRTSASYGVALQPGAWAQENRPFFTKARQSAMDRGYAMVTVGSGTGIVATASVIDNVTNDPTTIAMTTLAGAALWLPVASHGPGANGSQWRSDLGGAEPQRRGGERRGEAAHAGRGGGERHGRAGRGPGGPHRRRRAARLRPARRRSRWPPTSRWW